MPHNMTVTIEDPLWEKMKEVKEVRWSAIMKNAVERELRARSLLNRISKGKQFTEDEITKIALHLGKKVSGRS